MYVTTPTSDGVQTIPGKDSGECCPCWRGKVTDGPATLLETISRVQSRHVNLYFYYTLIIYKF